MTNPEILQSQPSFNRGDVIRTRGLYVPNVALYQAEPHPDIHALLFGTYINIQYNNFSFNLFFCFF